MYSRLLHWCLTALAVTAICLRIPGPLVQAQTPPAVEPSLALKVSADRQDALYRVGEVVTFNVEVTQDGKPLPEGEVTGILSRDGWKPQPSQLVKVLNGRATVTGQLDAPGFLLLRVTAGKISALAAAACDPLLIKPSLPVPDDFDDFWSQQKSALGSVPLNPSLTPVESPIAGVDAFDVQVECLGQPVSGYFGRPQNAHPKSLPAILFVHGAGVRSSSLGSVNWAPKEGGMLVLDINAHGIPNGRPAEFYEGLSQGELKDYRSIGRERREDCYFKGMFLRMIRGIDFLTAQPEWDGRTVIVYGSSQGGFQALAAAGLDSRVTFICAGVPAGCDHTGYAADRISGWPKIVPVNAEGVPDPAVMEASRYFDCVNFAAKAQCKGAAVTVGFIDTVCPPTGIHAAYNSLPCPKTIHFDVDAGHTNTVAASKFMQEAALQHVRAMK